MFASTSNFGARPSSEAGCGQVPHCPLRRIPPNSPPDRYAAARSVVAKNHAQGGSNNGKLYPHGSGGWKSKIKVSVELAPSEAGRETLFLASPQTSGCLLAIFGALGLQPQQANFGIAPVWVSVSNFPLR